MNITCPSCGGKRYNENNVCVDCGYFINQLSEGTLLMNRYKIIKAIKAGGMGAIYKACDTFSDETCALKQMFIYEGNNEVEKYILNRFTEEAELLVELDHPSIPKVKDYFHEQNNYYMIMDFVEGRDLYTYVTDNGKGLPEEVVIKWGIEICDVLDYLHSRPHPIIHRDINPTNLILRKKDQHLVLVDFGFARPVNPDSQEVKTSVGTEMYSAPEQCMGYPEPRSDLYSLGATMHFLLSAQQSTLVRFPPIRSIRPDVSDHIEKVIEKALNFNPKERFSSAVEMYRAISEGISVKASSEVYDEPVGQVSDRKPSIGKSLPIKKEIRDSKDKPDNTDREKKTSEDRGIKKKTSPSSDSSEVISSKEKEKKDIFTVIKDSLKRLFTRG